MDFFSIELSLKKMYYQNIFCFAMIDYKRIRSTQYKHSILILQQKTLPSLSLLILNDKNKGKTE